MNVYDVKGCGPLSKVTETLGGSRGCDGKVGGRAELGGRRSKKRVRRSSRITFSLFPDIWQAQRFPLECLLGCCEGCGGAVSLLRGDIPLVSWVGNPRCGLGKGLILRTELEGGYSGRCLPNES